MFVFTASGLKTVRTLYHGDNYRVGLKIFISRNLDANKFQVNMASWYSDGFLLPGRPIEEQHVKPSQNWSTNEILAREG